jgi:hypothetical protein
MLTPGTTSQAFTISDLNPVTDPLLELAGALHEVETPTGPNQGFENKKLTSEQLLAFLAAQLGGNSADGILFLPDGRAILSPARQAQLDAGELYYLHDDGTGYRQVVTAGTLPTNSPAQNSAALISMADGLQKP